MPERITVGPFPHYYAIVDDEDFDWLNQYNWRPQIGRNTVYAATGHGTLMHRLLVPDSDVVDHSNTIGLDNRRENLRSTTNSLNLANARKRSNTSSRFKGVAWVQRRVDAGLTPWYAYCNYEGKRYHLGFYPTEEEAAEVYNAKATELFGEFARLNTKH